MLNTEIQQVEIDIEDAKKAVELGKSLKRLEANRDFKKLILEGYLVNEAARMARLLGSSMVPEGVRDHLQRDILGPGALQSFFRNTALECETATRVIAESHETLDFLRAQEAEGEE